MQHTFNTFLVRLLFQFDYLTAARMHPASFEHAESWYNLRCPYLHLNQPSASSSIFHWSYRTNHIHCTRFPPFSLSGGAGWVRRGRFFFPSFISNATIHLLLCIHTYIYIDALRPPNLSVTAEHCHKHLYSSDIQATQILSYMCQGPCSWQPHWAVGKQKLY